MGASRILFQYTQLGRTFEYSHEERYPGRRLSCTVVQIVPLWCVTHGIDRPIVTSVAIESCKCGRKAGKLDAFQVQKHDYEVKHRTDVKDPAADAVWLSRTVIPTN